MSVENRIARLERQAGTGGWCAACDGPPCAEGPQYDASVWEAAPALELNVGCEQCGRPRRIVVTAIKRKISET